MGERWATERLACEEVRDLLAEHALGSLQVDRRAAVDRHLAWCAGCRKEASELADGMAVLALGLPAPRPAPGLEDRVVHSVTSAAGGRRRRPRRSQVAALAAAIVAATSVGWAVAMAGRIDRLEDAAATARDRANRAAGQFEAVLEDLGGDTPILSAPLDPAPGGEAGGRAIVFDSQDGEDFALVIVGGLPPEGEPYRAVLMPAPGNRLATSLAVGRLVPSADGQFATYRFFFEDLTRFRELVVLDRVGQTVLEGAFSPA